MFPEKFDTKCTFNLTLVLQHNRNYNSTQTVNEN